MGKTLVFGAVTWFLGGKIHSKRAVAKANKKHVQDQKAFIQQYYKDVGALQKANAELQQYVNHAAEVELDGQFRDADLNADNRVSRAEFNRYKAEYLKKNPEMAATFPRFEDFDPDSDGFISQREHQAYYNQLY